MHIFYHNRPFLHKWYNQIMTMSAERQPNTEAELEQYQYDNPFADLPSFEEMQRIRQQQQQQEHHKEEPADIDYGNLFGDDDYKPRHVAKDQTKEESLENLDLITNSPFLNGDGSDYVGQHEAKEQAEQQENHVVRRDVISKGEHSTIYEVEMADGTIDSGKLESEYLDMSEGFIKDHQELENRPDLKQELADLAHVIASLDATERKCFTEGDKDGRTEILEKYSKLRERLDDSATSKDDKDLINDFLGRLDQELLQFLSDHYDEEHGIERKSDDFEADIEEAKKAVEQSRKELEERTTQYDNILQEITEVRNSSRGIDFGLIYQLNNESIRTLNSIDDALKSYRTNNENCVKILNGHRNQLGGELFSAEIAATDAISAEINKKSDALEYERKKANDLRQKLEAIL